MSKSKLFLLIIPPFLFLISIILYFVPKLYSTDKFSFRYPATMYPINREKEIWLYTSKKDALTQPDCGMILSTSPDKFCKDGSIQAIITIKSSRTPTSTADLLTSFYTDNQKRSWVISKYKYPTTGSPFNNKTSFITSLKENNNFHLEILYPNNTKSDINELIKKTILSTFLIK